MLKIIHRLAAGTFVLGVLTAAVYGGGSKHSTPQDPPNPLVEPEPAGQTKPVEMPTYNPQPIVKPAYVPAKGEWKRYKIDGYYRWVWFSPNDKPVQSSKNMMVCGDCAGSGVEDGEVCSRCKGTGFVSTAPKAAMQSGGCANGQCGRSGRRGWR